LPINTEKCCYFFWLEYTSFFLYANHRINLWHSLDELFAISVNRIQSLAQFWMNEAFCDSRKSMAKLYDP
jgi:hypothetical protein